MKNTNDSLLQEFRHHPIFDDKDLIYKLLKSPVFLGYECDVSIPTRKELLTLFKHWYKVLLDRNFCLHFVVSNSELNYVHEVNRRLSLIAKFLPKEEVETVCKQMDEEDLKLQEKEVQAQKKSRVSGDGWAELEEQLREKRHHRESGV